MTRIFLFGLLGALSLNLGCGSAQLPAEMVVTAVAAIEGTTPSAAEGDWPWWRGPSFDGISADAQAPLNWDSEQNVRWRAAVPGRGHSSPAVVGDKVFITTADDDAEKQMLLCFDRASGDQLWEKIVHQGGFYKMHPKNSYASASPACDGEKVYVAFVNGDAVWVTAYDLDGEQLWQEQAGPFESEHGYGPSPLIYKSAVIVSGESSGPCWLAALDRASGEVKWRMARQRPGRHGNYASVQMATIAGRDQLLVPGLGVTTSLDPATGKLLWKADGPSEVAANTIAVGDGLVFSSGGYPEKNLLAIRADGSGDVTDSHIAWKNSKGVSYVPSMLYHDGLLYVVNDQGIASCYEAASGEKQWQKRLNGDFSSSPILAGDKIYATNEKGLTFVFRASREYELLAENDLGSGGFASPVICGGCIYLRTGDSLVCVADAETAVSPAGPINR